MKRSKKKQDNITEKPKPKAAALKKKPDAKGIGPKPPPPQENKGARIGLLDIDRGPQSKIKLPVQKTIPQRQKIEPERKPERKPEARKPFVDSCDLPESYNTTSLTLIARDPFWIYAYWEISPSSIEELRNQIGSGEFERSSYTLRMYDTTYKDFNGTNANHWFDIDVGPHASNWYVSIWNDNVTYCGEIGIRTPDGRFLAFARSNFVTTPRAGLSGRSDMMWMEVKEGSSEPPYVVAEARPKAQSFTGAEAGAKVSGRRIFLTEEDIRAYYSKLFPLLRRFISNRRLKEFSLKEFSLKEFSQGSFKYRLKGTDIMLEDFLIGDLSPGEFIKKIILGSSEEMILEGASESAKGGASEKQQKKKQFFFEIGTELIVYGRTEPDAEVWLGDKKIKLRDDGTFTLRFALPEGKIPLDFIARSKDKSQNRSIKTEVERSKTSYGSD